MTSPDPVVFVIEDDSTIRDAITWLLESVNLKVKTYPNGQAYLDEYDPKSYGCLIVDIRMPIMGGFELLEALNKKNNHMPVIFITGHGDVPMAVRAMQEGAFDFILKPFNDQVLLEKIQKAITNDKKWRETIENSVFPERLAKLTPRERAVWKCVSEGKLNKQIAAELEISSSTVEFHRANLMRKLQVKSVAQLIKSYILCNIDI